MDRICKLKKIKQEPAFLLLKPHVRSKRKGSLKGEEIQGDSKAGDK
jgi:hypothetical protein